MYLWWKRNHSSSQVNVYGYLLTQKAYRENVSSFLYMFPLARPKKRKELYGQETRLTLYARNSPDTRVTGRSFYPRHTRNTLNKPLPFSNADTPVLASSYKDCSFSCHLVQGATFLWIGHLIPRGNNVTPDDMRGAYNALSMVDNLHRRELQQSGVYNPACECLSFAMIVK